MKENQPDLLAALADAFDDEGVSPRERKLAEAERQAVTRCNKGHGRIERRTLTSTTALNGYAGWPGVAQCFKLVRERTIRGKTTSETVFGITSLPRERADAGRLLKLTRRHWQIENGLHWVSDVTFAEDLSQIRTGSSPQVMAAIRNLVISLHRLAGVTNIAKALRHHGRNALRPLQLLKII